MEAVFAVIGTKLQRPFSRLTYAEAMEKYGSDKPDLRVPFEMRDLTPIGRELSSEMLKGVFAAGGELKGLLIPGAGGLSRGANWTSWATKPNPWAPKAWSWIKKAGRLERPPSS